MSLWGAIKSACSLATKQRPAIGASEAARAARQAKDELRERVRTRMIPKFLPRAMEKIERASLDGECCCHFDVPGRSRESAEIAEQLEKKLREYGYYVSRSEYSDWDTVGLFIKWPQ